MADPVGREVDRVSVRVLPDTSRFLVSLEKYLQRIEQRLRVEIPTSLDTSGLVDDARRASAIIEANIGEIDVPVDVDTRVAEAEIAAVTRDRKVNVKVDVDRDGLTGLEQILGGLGGFTQGSQPLVILAAIVAALPAVVTAIEAIPAVLSAIALPIAAIALGIKGIKDAFVDSGLAAAFTDMAAVISDTFRNGLTPVFHDLVAIMPTLTTGFQQIAQAVILIAQSGVDQLTSPEGVAVISDLFSNIADAMTILAPSMGPLVASLLTLANEGAAAFARFAPKIAEFITTFSNMIDTMSKNGTLARAFDGLSKLLDFFGTFVLGLVFLSLTAMAAFDQLTDTISTVINGVNRLILGVVDKMKAIATEIQKVPAAILEMVKDFPDLLFHAGQALISGLADGIRDGLKNILPGPVDDVASFIKGHFPGSPVKEGPLTSWNHGGAGKRLMDSLADGIKARTDSVKSAARGVAGALDDIVPDATGMPGAGRGVTGRGQLFGDVHVQPHDYREFMREMQGRARLASDGGDLL